MKYKLTIATALLMATSSAVQLSSSISYKSDDMDDLLEGVITNKAQRRQETKQAGPVETLV